MQKLGGAIARCTCMIEKSAYGQLNVLLEAFMLAHHKRRFTLVCWPHRCNNRRLGIRQHITVMGHEMSTNSEL